MAQPVTRRLKRWCPAEGFPFVGREFGISCAGIYPADVVECDPELRNVKGRNESVRSIVVVQTEGKIRLGHPHTSNLDRQRGGKCWKDM